MPGTAARGYSDALRPPEPAGREQGAGPRVPGGLPGADRREAGSRAEGLGKSDRARPSSSSCGLPLGRRRAGRGRGQRVNPTRPGLPGWSGAGLQGAPLAGPWPRARRRGRVAGAEAGSVPRPRKARGAGRLMLALGLVTALSHLSPPSSLSGPAAGEGMGAAREPACAPVGSTCLLGARGGKGSSSLRLGRAGASESFLPHRGRRLKKREPAARLGQPESTRGVASQQHPRRPRQSPPSLARRALDREPEKPGSPADRLVGSAPRPAGNARPAVSLEMDGGVTIPEERSRVLAEHRQGGRGEFQGPCRCSRGSPGPRVPSERNLELQGCPRPFLTPDVQLSSG